MVSLFQIQEMWRNFTDDRPVMSKRNTHDWHTYSLLRREVDEAEAETDPEKIATELSDILLFVLTIANNHGIDMDVAVREKIALNMVRFPAHKFKDGDYEETRKDCKSKEKPIIKEFYSLDC